MAGYVGRKVIMTWGGVQIGGVQVKNLTLSGAPIDITDVQDSGWQELITTDLSQYDVKVVVTGVTKDQQIKLDWFGANFAKTLLLTYPDAKVINGSFVISAYSEAQNFKAAATYSVEFHSTGVVTFS